MRKLKIPDNLTSLAYRSIKEYILEGRLEENRRLTEEFLSGQLGISKSPIREAMNRLEAEGLIRIESRRGAYLRSFSPKEVDDLYGLREALEVHAVRTGIFAQELSKELRASVKRLRTFLKADDKAAYIDEDVHFHITLARATRNDQLCRAIENIQHQIWLFRRKTYVLSSSTSPDDHEDLVDAIERNDRSAAMEVMTRHISSVRKQLLDHLDRGTREECTAIPRRAKPRPRQIPVPSVSQETSARISA